MPHRKQEVVRQVKDKLKTDTQKKYAEEVITEFYNIVIEAALDGHIVAADIMEITRDKAFNVIRSYVDVSPRQRKNGVFFKDSRYPFTFEIKLFNVFYSESGYSVTPIIKDFHHKIVYIKLHDKCVNFIKNAKKGIFRTGFSRLGGRNLSRVIKAAKAIN